MKNLSVKMTRTEFTLGWIYMAVQLLFLPTVLVLLNLYLKSPLDEAELNFLFFCLNFLCVTVIFHKYLLACGKISLSEPGKCLLSAIFGYVIYWVLSLGVSMVILWVYPEFMNVNDAAIETMVDSNFALTAIGTILLVPVTEEVLFRGLIFQGLHHKNRFLAYAVSSIAFCLPHVLGYIGLYSPLHLLLCFLQYLPAGIALAWAYERSDSIWAPVIMHTFVNLTGVSAMIAR
jgi:membrane protease YdiL (CAAX protease family)